MLKRGLNATFHALADPTRRAMVERLSAGAATVSALGEPFDMSLPAVYQHVRILEGAGILATTKRGRERWCALQPAGLEDAAGWIAQHGELWNKRLDALEAHLQGGSK